MFTTNCTGDIGIEVDGRVVAQAFIHIASYGAYELHVYDLVLGGPCQVLVCDEALNLMLSIAKREAAR